MGTFTAAVQLGITFVLAVFLKQLLQLIENVLDGTACGSARPDTLVEGARNCAYFSEVTQWFLAIVLAAAFVFALTKGVTAGRVGA